MTGRVDVPTSLAAAALAAGKPGIGRSFRLHRRRGAFCHAGWCQQCHLALPDGSRVLACQAPATDDALRTIGGPDPLRAVGRFAETLPPWFWETRTRAPEFYRQPWLELLRRLSAAPALSKDDRGGDSRAWRRASTDLLVVGGGRAGLIAARRLADQGRRVLLVEAERLGGIARFLPEAESVQHLVAEASRAGAELRERTLCLGLYDGAARALLLGPDGPEMVELAGLVVAAGAYDRLPAFAGNDLPGIIGGRAFLRLAAAGALPKGLRIGLYSDEASAERLVVAARARAIAFDWIAGPGALPETAARMLPGVRLRRARGRGRIAEVELGAGRGIGCDLLVLGLSQPAYELQMQAGHRAFLAGDPPAVRTAGPALLPLLELGEAAGLVDGPDFADRVETAVQEWLLGREAKAPPSTAPLAPEPPDPTAFLCLCEDVRVGDCERAIEDGFADVELLKRRTGAGTGPCQGKLCHAELMACLARAGRNPALPTVRPLMRPVRLDALAGIEDGA